ncbi:glycosyltransferase [Cupriavidus basilensis]
MKPLAPIDLSIIIPAYNEADNSGACGRTHRPASGYCRPGLRDCDCGRRLHGPDSRGCEQAGAPALLVRCIQFSRNFGKEAGLEAGLAHARGQGVLFIDADLQHPPSLIPDMIAAWREGADVVNARKRYRGDEHPAYAVASRAFYRLFEYATSPSFPRRKRLQATGSAGGGRVAALPRARPVLSRPGCLGRLSSNRHAVRRRAGAAGTPPGQCLACSATRSAT